MQWDVTLLSGSNGSTNSGCPLAIVEERVAGQVNADEEIIRRRWPNENEPEPGASIIAVLRVALKLQPFTKETSDDWSKRVFVPLITLSDAGSNEKICRAPALLAIWRQKGVKSAPTFRSRSLTMAFKCYGAGRGLSDGRRLARRTRVIHAYKRLAVQTEVG